MTADRYTDADMERVGKLVEQLDRLRRATAAAAAHATVHAALPHADDATYDAAHEFAHDAAWRRWDPAALLRTLTEEDTR